MERPRSSEPFADGLVLARPRAFITSMLRGQLPADDVAVALKLVLSIEGFPVADVPPSRPPPLVVESLSRLLQTVSLSIMFTVHWQIKMFCRLQVGGPRIPRCAPPPTRRKL